MNNIQLNNPDDNSYDVIHNGVAYRCERVTYKIAQTRPTPQQLIRWMVNSAVASLECPECYYGLLDGKEQKAYAWAAHQAIGKKATDTGSLTHYCIETGKVPTDPEALQALKAFELFKKNYNPVPLIHELRVYDTTNLVAGSIDFIGWLNNDKKTIWILDWKTSSQITEEYLLQVSIYQQILQRFVKEYKKNPSQYSPEIQKQMNPLIASLKRVKIRCGVVRLDKHIPVRETTQPKFEFRALDISEVKNYQNEFKLIVKLTNLRRERWERKKQERDAKRLLSA